MIILADDVEGRAFERPPVAGKHQLIDVVFVLINAFVVIADIAEDIRRRADLAPRDRAVKNHKNRMPRSGHIVNDGFAVRTEHRCDTSRLVFEKSQHFFPVHDCPPPRLFSGFHFVFTFFFSENVPADLFAPGKVTFCCFPLIIAYFLPVGYALSSKFQPQTSSMRKPKAGVPFPNSCPATRAQ